jgi:4-hydroxybenzoate polyprenyltransferase
MAALLFGLYAVSPHLGSIYLVGVTGVALLLLYEHWIVRPDDLTRVNQAFFVMNGIISVGLLGIVLLQISVGK